MFSDWLKKDELEYLIDRLVPRDEPRRRQYWLRLSWDEASELIPLWAEFAINETKKRKIERVITKGGYFEFWRKLLDGFNQKLPNVAKRNALNQLWLSIPAGYHHIHFEWYFRKSKSKFCIALHFEYPDYERNKKIFEYFYDMRERIQKEFIEDEVIFDKEWGERWSQIYVKRLSITFDEENQIWGIDRMVRFYGLFKPLLDSYFVINKKIGG